MVNISAHNNFNALRLLAAAVVLLSHGEFLYQLSLTVPFAGHSLGAVGVYVFFFISGYLVTQSWERDPSLDSFATKRFGRIFPGLLVAVVVTVFVIGPLMTQLPAADYWRDAGTWLYLVNNAVGLSTVQVLPGVFENTPFARAVNGSLWTIRYELLMYGLLAVLSLWGIRRSRHTYALMSALLASLWLLMAAGLMDDPFRHAPTWFQAMWSARELCAMGVYFFIGSLFAQHRIVSQRWMGLLGACALLLAAWSTSPSVIQLGLWLGLPCVVFHLAHTGPPWLRGRPHTDVSYGIYIYAFPIQQSITHLSLAQGWSLAVCLSLSLLITTLVATASWLLVEKPALRWSQRMAAQRKTRTQAAPVRPAPQVPNVA